MNELREADLEKSLDQIAESVVGSESFGGMTFDTIFIKGPPSDRVVAATRHGDSPLRRMRIRSVDRSLDDLRQALALTVDVINELGLLLVESRFNVEMNRVEVRIFDPPSSDRASFEIPGVSCQWVPSPVGGFAVTGGSGTDAA